MILELGDFLETDPVKGQFINPFLLDCMEAEGMQAMVPGVKELSHWNLFQDLMADRSIEVVCSNVTRSSPVASDPLAPRSLVITVNEVRIGLLGIVGTEEFGKVESADSLGFLLQDPLECIAELAPGLAAEADLVVVMAAVNDKDATALAREIEGVDIVLGGHYSIASDRPLDVNGVIVSRCGLRGIYLATTRVIVDPAGEIIEWFGYNHALNNKVEGDSLMQKRVDEIDTKVNLARREAYRKKMQGASLQAPPDRFLGVSTCGRCHAQTVAQWSRTAHAHAMQTLAREGKEGDPACIGCHVTVRERWTTPDLRPAAPDPNLVDVQCEACHGPGNQHRRGTGMNRVAEAVCRGCHTEEWSPDWNYRAALEKVKHSSL